MKKVVIVSLAGRSFTLEEDAYKRLKAYLDHYRSRLTVSDVQKGEVMEEIEERIAELFGQQLGGADKVVTLPLVEQVAQALGMPDGTSEGGSANPNPDYFKTGRKLYRDPDEMKIAGVCSGLSLYLDLDVTLIRVLMLVALVFGGTGFWVYIILWIAIPMADTSAKKCELRGLSPTAENMSRFTSYEQ